VAFQFWGRRTADDFELCSLSRVRQVRWWGGSDNGFFNDLRNFSDWVIVVYAASGALPAAEIHTESFTQAQTTPVATGQTNSLGGIEFEQIVTLDEPLDLPAGFYWISIGTVNVEPLDDCWLWSSNLDDVNGVCAQEVFGGSPYALIAGDRAFEIIGDGTPCGCAQAGCELGDFNGDCVISIEDLAVFISNYGLTGVGVDGGDFDDDGVVGLSDLATMVAIFGNDCR
jgi:hypothetical protein